MLPSLDNSNNKDDVFRAFNVQGKKNFEEKPTICPLCGHNEMGAVELLGVKPGPFFWECDRCSSRFLRYSIRETQQFLMDAEGLWYDLEDLDTIWMDPPN